AARMVVSLTRRRRPFRDDKPARALLHTARFPYASTRRTLASNARRANISSMLNYIWFGLMLIAVIVAAFTGTAGEVTKGAIDSAKTAVEIAIGLVGVMSLWLGVMRIAEAAGLVKMLGRALRPVMRWLFPELPSDHPACGAIVLSLAANMLGLSNAATPLGIKAMEEMQSLNDQKDTATNPMVMFIVL